MEPLIITLPLFDLTYDKIKEAICHEITLFDTHFTHKLDAYYDSHPKPDDDLGIVKEDEYYNHFDFVLKSAIVSIESNYSNEHETWVLSIYCSSGRYNDCKFPTEDALRKVEKQLHNWLLKTK